MNVCSDSLTVTCQSISDLSILQEGRNVLSIERDAIDVIDQTLGQPLCG